MTIQTISINNELVKIKTVLFKQLKTQETRLVPWTGDS